MHPRGSSNTQQPNSLPGNRHFVFAAEEGEQRTEGRTEEGTPVVVGIPVAVGIPVVVGTQVAGKHLSGTLLVDNLVEEERQLRAEGNS